MSGSHSVLVVDDYAELRELAEVILRQAGYTVFSASTGREALEVAGTHAGSIDVALVDIHLPDMIGTDLVKALLPANPDMRILFMTGESASSIDAGGGFGRPIGVIEKPFMAGDLLASLDNLIRMPG